jgi:hypothetical protein
MKIIKKLKYAAFEWSEEGKSFMITEQDGNRVILNKVYAFAFMRFVIRTAQRNWLRTKSPKKIKEPAKLAEHPFENSNQEEFDMFNVVLPEGYDEEDFNEIINNK